GPLLGSGVRDAASAATSSAVATERRAPLAAAMVCGATMLSMIDLLTIYLPVLGAERGLSASFVGVLLSLRAGAGMASRLGYGAVVQQIGRAPMLVGAVAMTAASLAVMMWDGPVAVL